MSDESDPLAPHAIQLGIQPIGVVEGGRSDRRDDGWDRELATIRLFERFGVDSLTGLEEFSHIEVVFRFHRLSDDEVTRCTPSPWEHRLATCRHLRAAGQSAADRLGVTVCRLVGSTDVMCGCRASTRSTAPRFSTSSR